MAWSMYEIGRLPLPIWLGPKRLKDVRPCGKILQASLVQVDQILLTISGVAFFFKYPTCPQVENCEPGLKHIDDIKGDGAKKERALLLAALRKRLWQ